MVWVFSVIFQIVFKVSFKFLSKFYQLLVCQIVSQLPMCSKTLFQEFPWNFLIFTRNIFTKQYRSSHQNKSFAKKFMNVYKVPKFYSLVQIKMVSLSWITPFCQKSIPHWVQLRQRKFSKGIFEKLRHFSGTKCLSAWTFSP